jgi:hypothetical protein
MTSISRRYLLKAGIATSASIAFPFSTSSRLEGESRTSPVSADSNSQQVLDLSGGWRFRRDDHKQGMDQNWFANILPANGTGPSEIVLPETTDQARAGIPNPEAPSLSGLYRPNLYTGPAWYQREIEIPLQWKGKPVTLFIERTHWVTHAWLDGKALGTQESLIAPHVYDLGTLLSPGKHQLTICVDNTLLFDLGRFVSVYYEGTQTNWNGIIGRIELRAHDPVSLTKIQTYPDVNRKSVRVTLMVGNSLGSRATGNISLSVTNSSGRPAGSDVMVPFAFPGEEMVLDALVSLGSEIQLWDEFTPNLYTLHATLSTKGKPACHDEQSVTFGMRELSTRGTQFTMNRRPLMLRGTLECAIFPLTAFPPTDVDSWRRIYQIEKSYGFNFIRFHSWTPPEAAFTAADLEGVLIQTEGPQANVPTGVNQARDEFVERELMRIVDTYGNHPSFALMTIGNEYGGSESVITHWVDRLINADSRHLYSSASANTLKSANRQFTEDAHLRGVHGPGTDFDYTAPMAKEDRPLIGHEIGQWTFYPNLEEIGKYTGVLKAKNFELVRDDLAKKGMLDQAQLFLESTGKHAILLYKDEIECILRSRGYAGFSLLDLHDYPGQGTALIGLLDPFWDSKGLITPEEHKRYAGAIVPLLRFPKRTYNAGEVFEATAELANFGPADIRETQGTWLITDQAGAEVASGVLSQVAAPTGTVTQLGRLKATLAKALTTAKLTVNVSLRDTAYSNSWNIWVYSSVPAALPGDDMFVSNVWGSEVKNALAQGKKVVLFPSGLRKENTLKGSFKPVFWSPIWFESDPATMGILVNPGHPLFRQFPTDMHSDWQWDSLIESSQSVILNETPANYRPIVQVVDNFARNHKLGNVFEARVGTGRLLVCTLCLNQQEQDKQTPEQRQFLNALYAYAASDTFAPTQELGLDALGRILASGV